MLKITYDTDAGYGMIVLDPSSPAYPETLRNVEQHLAETKARNIEYEKDYIEDSCDGDSI